MVAWWRDGPGWVISLAVAIVVAAVFWDHPINHDNAWYLFATRRWLAGERLYLDLIEVNPPLAFYLTAPAILLADLVGISDLNAQYVVLALAVGGVLLACWPVQRDGERQTPAAIMLLLGVAFSLVVPAFDGFGQRDHLVLMCLFPWLLAHNAAAPAGGRGQTMRALLAGVGVCLKPFYLLVLLGAVVGTMVARRSARVLPVRDLLVFAGVGASYLFAVLIMHQEYFSLIVPVARDVYGAYTAGDTVLIDRLHDPALGLAFAVTLAGWLTGAGRLIGLPIFGALGGAVLAYLVQRTGFAYQIIPAAGLVAWICWRALVDGRCRTLPALLAVLGVLTVVQTAISRGYYSNAMVDRLAPHVRRLDPAPRLYALAAHLIAGPGLALATNGRWDGKFPALWWVPGAANGRIGLDCAAVAERCRRLDEIDALTRRLVIDDLERLRPSVLVIEEPPGFVRDRSFTWARFFADEPRYDLFMAGYERRLRSANYSLWTPRTGESSSQVTPNAASSAAAGSSPPPRP